MLTHYFSLMLLKLGVLKNWCSFGSNGKQIIFYFLFFTLSFRQKNSAYHTVSALTQHY